MRTRTTIVATLVVAALGLTACGPDSGVTTTPDKKTAAPTSAPAAKPSSVAPKKDAGIGDTLTLKGNSEGEQLAVTLKKWADPAKSKDEFMSPQDGMRWVAAQFELVNTGSKIYDDSPGNGAQVADAEGQRFMSTFGDITAGPSMASAVKLPKGEKALGWIVFEVPKASKIASVQFTMNSGFSNNTGQWSVK
ncbi:DUF4352 domain-containing protein [Streptomyces sp. NPDC006339]|uniref:DUF4352 domain-containing protein n=1 Tax=Streptomyces sp. NPDC006339 TaxID=3156755 RepID=UPI0033AEE601